MDLSEIQRGLAAAPALQLLALQKAVRSGLRPLLVPTPMRLSQWMAKHFYLSEESSYEKGKWQAYPFQTSIADCMGHDDIPFVTWRKPSRVGYTKIFLAAIAYFAEHKRRNQVVYQPTDDDRDEFVTTELEPMLRDVQVMRRAFPKFNRKSKENTLRQKRFLGCLLHLRGARAAKNFRRLTVDNVYYDESDGFDADVEKEGSPFKLGDKRLEGATFPKSIAGSTPKMKGFSLIENREAEADQQFRFHVPCAHCDVEHQLVWGGKDSPYGFKWRGDDPDSAAHVCPHCGAWMTQAEYLQVWKRGRWKTHAGLWIDPECRFLTMDDIEVPPPRHVAFHLWTAYSPQATWSSIVREWLSAVDKARTGNDSDLKTFINTTLGESYEQEVERTESGTLEKRAEDFPLRTVPQGAVKLACGVDVQADRWECVTWAIGRGEETWAIDYQVIYGNPADQREWNDKLEPYLETAFQHAGGAELRIDAAAIDTGGHFTHQCYVFVRNRPQRKWFAVKGESRPGKPIKSSSSLQDVNERGRVVRRGVRLWFVGTDTAKDLLHGRLQVTQPGPGCVHFSRHLPREFFEQLTSESRVPVRTSRGEEYRWIKPAGRRNEVLDCTVYVLFCIQALELHKWSDRNWAQLERSLEPDLFADLPAAQVVPAPTPPAATVSPSAPQPKPMSAAPAPAPVVAKRLAPSTLASSEWSKRL